VGTADGASFAGITVVVMRQATCVHVLEEPLAKRLLLLYALFAKKRDRP
jgi:hypothetical protein